MKFSLRSLAVPMTLIASITSGCATETEAAPASTENAVVSGATKLDADSVVAVDDSAAYTLAADGLAARSVDVVRFEHGGAAGKRLATVAVDAPVWILGGALDASNVFLNNRGKVLRIPKTGGEAVDMRAPCAARALAVGGEGVVFSCTGGGLMKLSSSGGSAPIVAQSKVDEIAEVGSRVSLLGGRVESAEITGIATNGGSTYVAILRYAGRAQSVAGVIVAKVEGSGLRALTKPKESQSYVSLAAADGAVFLLDTFSRGDFSDRRLWRITEAGESQVTTVNAKAIAASSRGLVLTTYGDDAGFEKLLSVEGGVPRTIAKSQYGFEQPAVAFSGTQAVAYATTRYALVRIGAGPEPIDVKATW